MEVYHPYFHISAESGYLSNTLFVFSKDYASVMEIFPETEYWELQASALLERIILTDPNENDIIRLRSVVAKSTGRYLHIQTIEDYLSSATVSGVRTHQIYLIFYSVATTILLAAMFLNLYRIMKRKIPDYSIHNLFGASDVFIYCRMFYFAVLYNAIPIIWTVCIMSLNKMATPLNLMVLISIIILTVLIIVEIIHKQFKIHFLQGLRRE